MKSFAFSDQGNGPVVMLLHGFPFHRGIWDEFIPLISDRHRVIAVDLPGFGESERIAQPFGMRQVADTLLDFIEQKKLSDIHIVGHSLGGYIALEMVNKRAALFASLTLFHSTAYADSDEKKESRLKVVDFVKKNGPVPFATGFIDPLFAKPEHPAIETVKGIASTASAEAIIGYTLAMKDRTEHLKTLQIFKNPTMFIVGEKDPGISVESIQKQALHSEKPRIEILEDVAHMGMFEKPVATAGKIADFVAKSHV